MSGLDSALVSWLLRHGLLDRLDLLVFPVLLGSGKRLFSEPDGQVPLTLRRPGSVRHRHRAPDLHLGELRTGPRSRR